MRIDVLTIFPDWFSSPLGASLLGRARREGTIEVVVHDLRRWTSDVHRTVDDDPFGGGAGMVMQADPFFAAVEDLYGAVAARPHTLLLTPRGRRIDQPQVLAWSRRRSLLLLCGRYEGIDERVHLHLADAEVSVADVVLGGGEAAAYCLIEAVARLLPGVMGNADSARSESFAPEEDGTATVEYPHYTRPATYRGWSVPAVLRSGDHGRIAAWRAAQAMTRTRLLRPDLTDP